MSKPKIRLERLHFPDMSCDSCDAHGRPACHKLQAIAPCVDKHPTDPAQHKFYRIKFVGEHPSTR
jgi:hypothetical protein